MEMKKRIDRNEDERKEAKKARRSWWKENGDLVIAAVFAVAGAAAVTGACVYSNYENNAAKNNMLLMNNLNNVSNLRFDPVEYKKSLSVFQSSAQSTHDTVSMHHSTDMVNSVISNADPIIIDPITRAPHDVSAFLRKLPDGWHASQKQLDAAAMNGFDVPNGFTFVNPHKADNTGI